MSYLYDEDEANIYNSEVYAEVKWEREKKNEILAMADSQKKQVKWNQLFATPTYSDEINNMVF